MTAATKSVTVEELVARAQAAHAAQDMAKACEAIGKAADKMPDHPAIAFMHAQFAYEGWYDSAPLFERAAALNPGNADLVRNFALALISEGQADRAERLLEGILARSPAWLDGLNVLATLRTTRADDDPLRGFEQAALRDPVNASIYQAWFHKLSAARDWKAAGEVLAKADEQLPEPMKLARLYLECESGEAPADPSIFDEFGGSNDPGIALMMVRHALRNGEPERALSLVEAQLEGPAAGQFWPYASLCWRLLDDPKAEWLEGEPPSWNTIDLEFDEKGLGQLAEFLRNLHRMNAPYPEQSIRGGTQTDRNLLLHHDPVIQRLRTSIVDAVEAWREGLPGADDAHPFLGKKPDAIRFSGSWSVRLREGGHHSAHTHPRGWASSALYVTVPDEPGEDHAGELALGLPPSDLGLDLEPRTCIEPRPGRLVLFPSITWHGTVSFSGDERMTVAFDVAPGNPNRRV